MQGGLTKTDRVDLPHHSKDANPGMQGLLHLNHIHTSPLKHIWFLQNPERAAEI